MSAWPAYSRKQWIRAVNYSAVVGYCFVIGVPAAVNGNLGGAFVAAIIGIPAALICCWVFAAPALKYLMRKEFTWLGAALGGASIAALMAIVSIAFQRHLGWRVSLDPDRSYGAYRRGGTTVVDGILTPHGWLLLAESTLYFVATGAVVGMIVKPLVGHPAHLRKRQP